MNTIIFNRVKIACQSLDDLELAAINNVAQVGMDPRKVKGYEKVSHLFTENGGTAMHPETQEALASVVLQRFMIDRDDGNESWRTVGPPQENPPSVSPD